ncbi:MAG: tetratricopeptide repeat protein, partial [Longimicrobiales bacterium]
MSIAARRTLPSPMRAVPVRVIAFSVLALAAMATDASAQEPCPRASGPDAEAGWAAYGAGDVASARTRFEAALARCDDDQYARTGFGYVLLREGAVSDAVEAWTRVVAAQPDNVDALAGLGLAAWRTGDLAQVRARFTRVVELVPDHATARDYLGRVSEDEPATGPLDAADRAWDAGDSGLALELYTARLAGEPDDETALLRVGLMRAWAGDYDESLELLDRLIARAPGNLEARLARARVRAWSGDVPGAQREVSDVLAVRPDHPEALEALSTFQAWSGDLDESLGTYDDLISITPLTGASGRLRAQTLARAAQFEASRAAYDALLAADPGDVEARLGLAQTLAYAGLLDEAIAEYDRVLASSPDEVDALVGRGRTLGWDGQFVAGERSAAEATRVAPESADAWAGLGQLYRWQGRSAEAVEALERAAVLAPTSAEILDQLRSARLALAPLARPTVVYESDSDDNRMWTTSLMASWHPFPRLDVQARAYHRALEQGIFRRRADGVSVAGAYQVGPGWIVSVGVGGSRTNGTAATTLVEYQAGVRTPQRHALGGGVQVASTGTTETAALAELAGRSTEVTLSARWSLSPVWRVDGSAGLGKIAGREDNGRRSASLTSSLQVLSSLWLGVSMRGFSYEKNLTDGYFDPDFYGIAEATAQWLY